MARQRRSRLLLVLLVGLLLAASAEGVIRARQWMRYGVAGESFHRFVEHPESGLRVPEPGLVDGRAHRIEVNADGFRGPPLDRPKPEGRRRIAFLGGSTTFCAEASRNETTWPHLVSAGLAAAFPDVDHVNAGVGGYAVAQSRLNLAHRVAPLAPDVIVIYHATNDLSSGTRELAVAAGLAAPRAHEPSWLAQHSLAWNLIEKNWLRGSPSAKTTGGETLDPDPTRHAERFAQNLGALVSECRAVAPVVVLVTFSHKARREQDDETRAEACESSLFYMPYMSVDGILTGIEAYNDVIRRVAAEQGGLLVAGELGIPGDAEHFADSVHFTDAGCARQAERILQVLLAAPEVAAVLGP